jgi:hypothetical protein
LGDVTGPQGRAYAKIGQVVDEFLGLRRGSSPDQNNIVTSSG